MKRLCFVKQALRRLGKVDVPEVLMIDWVYRTLPLCPTEPLSAFSQ